MRALRDRLSDVPLIVDAGLGLLSHACQVMEGASTACWSIRPSRGQSILCVWRQHLRAYRKRYGRDT
jgi:Thiazole biosynthesis protein ThiG